MTIHELIETTYNTTSSLEILNVDTEELIESFDTVQEFYKTDNKFNNKDVDSWCCDEFNGEIRLNIYIKEIL